LHIELDTRVKQPDKYHNTQRRRHITIDLSSFVLYKNTYLRRYEWPWRLTTRRNRRRPSWPWTLDITGSRAAEDGRHPGWDWHSDRHRAHRMHHYSGIDEWWHRMNWMDRSRRPAVNSSLWMRRWRRRVWRSGPERTWRPWCIRSSWPTTWRHM